MNYFVIIVVILIFIMQSLPFFYANSVIQSWTAESELTLVSKEFRFIRVGPFINHRNRAVYKIAVKTPEGKIKKAWIMIGNAFLLDPKEYRVVWEGEPGSGLLFGQKLIYPLVALFNVIIVLFLLMLVCMFFYDFGISDYFKEAAKKWD